jgi:hypothetical protein
MDFLRPTIAVVAAIAFASVALAQPAPAPKPALPPPAIDTAPPPLPAVGADPELEPQVTIIKKDTETVEEVRVNGELKYVRVTPRYGKPYYLVPSGNGQTFLRYDSLDSGLKVPMWLLFSW